MLHFVHVVDTKHPWLAEGYERRMWLRNSFILRGGVITDVACGLFLFLKIGYCYNVLVGLELHLSLPLPPPPSPTWLQCGLFKHFHAQDRVASCDILLA